MPVNRYDVTGHSAGQESSSTYEGRHLTILEDLMVHPAHADAFVDKGDPVLVGENIVGVAFNSAAANTDQIAIDTEGIWFLNVQAENDEGFSNIAIGDELFINKSNGLLSKIRNKNTHQRFGYALSAHAWSAGSTGIVAVKVHWDPDDGEEVVGNIVAQWSSDVIDKIFRHYRYVSTAASGDIRGEYLKLHLAGGASGEAFRSVTQVDVATGGGAHGEHVSLMFGALGALTGLGAASRQTLYLPNRALAAGGGYYGGMTEIFLDGNDSDISPVTQHAILRVVVDGGNTAAQNRVKNAMAFEQTKGTDGAGNMFYSHDHAAGNAAGSIRVLINGVVKYLKFWAAE